MDKQKKVIQAVQLVTAHQGPVGAVGLFVIGQPELANMLAALQPKSKSEGNLRPQGQRFWLKLDAPLNMRFMFVTELTSQFEMSELKV